jgi:hypothetical protein
VLISRIEGGANYAVLARYGIQSFPIIALFIPGDRRIKNVYQGPRTFERFNEWITALCPVIEIKNNTNDDNSNSNVTSGNNSSESELDEMKMQIEKMKNEFNEMNKALNETKEKMNNLRSSNDNSSGSNSSSNSKGKKLVIEIDMSISSVIKFSIFVLVVIAVIITAKKLVHYNASKKDKIYDR